jgi:hypothetical protein
MQSVDEAAKAVQKQIAEDKTRFLSLESMYTTLCKESQLLQNQLHELNDALSAAKSEALDASQRASASESELVAVNAARSEQMLEVSSCVLLYMCSMFYSCVSYSCAFARS